MSGPRELRELPLAPRLPLAPWRPLDPALEAPPAPTGRDAAHRAFLAGFAAEAERDAAQLREMTRVHAAFLAHARAPVLAAPAPVERVLDPAVDTWLQDHRPTHATPTLPMMGMLEELARAAPGPVHGFRDVAIRRWLAFEGPRRVRARRDGALSILEASSADGWEEVARGEVLLGDAGAPPDPLPRVASHPVDDPYESGHMFHGPAFQLLTELYMGDRGSSARLDPARCGVPVGVVHPGLLDASLHAIPLDELHRWDPRLRRGSFGFPLRMEELRTYGPPPTTGEVRVEVRLDGDRGGRPVFHVQLQADGRVWAWYRVVMVVLAIAPLARIPARHRAAFLGRREHVPGVAPFARADGSTVVSRADLDAFALLPATLEHVYGATRPREIALKEHLAARRGTHPYHTPADPTGLRIEDDGREIRVTGPEERR